MGEITDVSYFNNVESCGMIEDECNNKDITHHSFNKVNCCDNIHDLIQGKQTQQQALDNFKIDQVQFIIVYSYSYLEYCSMADNNKGSYWLSYDKEIFNPFFGAGMLKCGEVKKTY